MSTRRTKAPSCLDLTQRYRKTIRRAAIAALITFGALCAMPVVALLITYP